MHVALCREPDLINYIPHEGRGAEVVLYANVTKVESEDGVRWEADMFRHDDCALTRDEVVEKYEEMVTPAKSVNERIEALRAAMNANSIELSDAVLGTLDVLEELMADEGIED